LVGSLIIAISRNLEILEARGASLPNNRASARRLPKAIGMELQKVGEDDVRESGAVLLELLAHFDVVQVGDARLLGLDVASDMLLTTPDTHVRVACLSLTREDGQRGVRAAELRPQLLPELLEHVIV